MVGGPWRADPRSSFGLVVDGRVGATLQEQADHLEMTVRDRPVQAGPPEVGRDVGADAVVKEPAHDLGPAVLAGVDECLGDEAFKIAFGL